MVCLVFDTTIFFVVVVVLLLLRCVSVTVITDPEHKSGFVTVKRARFASARPFVRSLIYRLLMHLESSRKGAMSIDGWSDSVEEPAEIASDSPELLLRRVLSEGWNAVVASTPAADDIEERIQSAFLALPEVEQLIDLVCTDTGFGIEKLQKRLPEGSGIDMYSTTVVGDGMSFSAVLASSVCFFWHALLLTLWMMLLAQRMDVDEESDQPQPRVQRLPDLKNRVADEIVCAFRCIFGSRGATTRLASVQRLSGTVVCCLFRLDSMASVGRFMFF